MSLHADARAVLAAWLAPDEAQEALRCAFIELLDAQPDGMFRHCQPEHVTGSALIVRGYEDGDGEVLLVRHAKAGKWLQTGGHCEPADVTLAQAALREAREESGIDSLTVDPVPLQLSRHAVPFCGPPPRGGHHLDVQFLVHAPADAEIDPGADEDEARWFPLDAAAVPEPTDQDVRDLIAAAKLRLNRAG
jgi:ADP-ribose pyrophosphatase YjhB (NUDIX family)